MGTLNYVLRQEKREESKEFGKWYARAVHGSDMTTEELAQQIQRNVSAKKSDVLAVLAEMSEVMADAIQSGRVVVLDGIGRFGLVWNNTKYDAGASAIVRAYNYRKSRCAANNILGEVDLYVGFNFGARGRYKKK